MGKYRQGILGSFSGKIGTVIGSSWNGIDYMKGLPKLPSGPASEKQIVQRAKFKLVASFTSTLTKLVRVTFTESVKGMSTYNAAIQYALNNMVKGVYPAFTIDFPNALVAKGSLLNGAAATAASAPDASVTFNWTDNSGSNGAKTEDRAILVVLCEELGTSSFTSS